MTESLPKTRPVQVLPMSQYLSLHLMLSLLLCFSFLYLPRSTQYLDLDIDSSSNTTNSQKSTIYKQTSSTDRPEHPFLTPITSLPLATMLWDVAGVGLCMIWWGGHLRGWWKLEKNKMKSREGVDAMEEVLQRQNAVGEAFASIWKSLGVTVLVSIPGFVLLVLLGAPLDSHLPHTYLLSLHLSLLMVYPILNSLGIPSLYQSGTFDRFRLTRLLCEFSPRNPLERATVYPIGGAAVGAWIGVIPFALDWDRPWQSYPLPPTFFSIIGYIIGGLISFGISEWEEASLDLLEKEAASVAAVGSGEVVAGKKKGKKGKGGK